MVASLLALKFSLRDRVISQLTEYSLFHANFASSHVENFGSAKRYVLEELLLSKLFLTEMLLGIKLKLKSETTFSAFDFTIFLNGSIYFGFKL